MPGITTPDPRSPFRGDILAGRVVLITGGATGIGYACAEAFGAHGAKVAIMSRRQKVIDGAVSRLQSQGIDAFGTTVDVRDYDRCVSATNIVAKHFGRIDFLINNAAGNFMVSTENLTSGGFSTVLGIDLQGVFHMSKSCLPHLKQTGRTDGSVIVNITATLQDQATPFQSHAAAAKAGIDVLTNQMGVEWAEYGIRTIGLAPGGIAGTVGGPGGRVFGNNENKASTDNVLKSGDANSNAVAENPVDIRKRGIPAGRWGRVGDVSLAAVFACSSAATWITATRLTIDGGSVHRVRGFVEMKTMIDAKSAKEKATFKGGVIPKSKL
jgi:peroxisomal 2,4-dienoyl-CoA reductase